MRKVFILVMDKMNIEHKLLSHFAGVNWDCDVILSYPRSFIKFTILFLGSVFFRGEKAARAKNVVERKKLVVSQFRASGSRKRKRTNENTRNKNEIAN